MGEVRMRVKTLTSEQAQEHIDKGRFEDVIQVNKDENGDQTTVSGSAEINIRTNGNRKGFLRIEQGYDSVVFQNEKSTSLLFVTMFRCGSSSCDEVEKSVATKFLKDRVKRELRPIPKGAHVEEVRAGDANRDGQTDILLKLSSGAYLLYQQLLLRPNNRLNRVSDLDD